MIDNVKALSEQCLRFEARCNELCARNAKLEALLWELLDNSQCYIGAIELDDTLDGEAWGVKAYAALEANNEQWNQP